MPAYSKDAEKVIRLQAEASLDYPGVHVSPEELGILLREGGVLDRYQGPIRVLSSCSERTGECAEVIVLTDDLREFLNGQYPRDAVDRVLCRMSRKLSRDAQPA